MNLSLIAAMSTNRVIGFQGRLPWHLPLDLKYFRDTTWGHSVIMGRLTWDSVGRPLRGRRNIVITRNPAFSAPGADVAGSFEEALGLTCGESEVFVVGGAQIYSLALPCSNRIYLTLIHAQFEGDTWFPEFEGPDWVLSWREDHPADPKHAVPFSFLRYERVVSDLGPQNLNQENCR